MSIVIDLIIIVVAIAAVYHGISKGFIKSAMRFASLIIAIICVFTLTSPLAAWLDNAFVSDSVSQITEDSLDSIVSAGTEKLSIDQVLADRPDALTDVADRFSCNLDELVSYYNNFLKSFTEPDALKALSEKIAAPTSNAISTVAAAIIIFVAAMLVCTILTYVLDLIFKLPVLKQLNKLLGTLFGIASAILSALIIANISIGLVNALGSILPNIFNESVVSGSVVLNFFMKSGLLLS